MNKLIHNGHIIVDKLVTAKHTIVGEDLARSILKATADEIVLPKRKYVDYLVMCTEDQNVSVTEMCKLILDRTHHSSWVVNLKALIIVHEIMNYGNERFFQYMASDNQSLNLDTFSDRTDTISLLMSKHVRSYATYINSKAVSFRIVGYDFCKVKRGGKEAFFKTLNTKKLFKNLFQLQNQLDSLLAFKPASSDLMNKLIVHAISVTFKDLVRLVACLNDGTANLLENFSTLNRKDCQQSLSLYTYFPNYLKQISRFYKIAEDLNFESSQMPSLKQVPDNLHDRMEEHIKGLELGSNKSASILPPLPKPDSKKKSLRRLSMPTSSFLPAQPSTPHESSYGVTTAPILTSLSPSSSSPFANNFGDVLSLGYKEQEKMLEEEERILEKYRKQKGQSEQEKSPTWDEEEFDIIKNSNAEDLFSLNVSLPRQNNSNATTPISITPKKASTTPNLSTSLPPGFMQGEDILEPTRLHSNVTIPPIPPSPSSPPTPVLLDFSKVSLPPSNFMPPSYPGLAYNQMNPLAPTQISAATLFPNNFNNQLGSLQQQHLQLEQQKQLLQKTQKNPFFY